jgi:hypothetical protein
LVNFKRISERLLTQERNIRGIGFERDDSALASEFSAQPLNKKGKRADVRAEIDNQVYLAQRREEFIDRVISENIGEGIKIAFAQPRIESVEPCDRFAREPAKYWRKAVGRPWTQPAASVKAKSLECVHDSPRMIE